MKLAFLILYGATIRMGLNSFDKTQLKAKLGGTVCLLCPIQGRPHGVLITELPSLRRERNHHVLSLSQSDLVFRTIESFMCICGRIVGSIL